MGLDWVVLGKEADGAYINPTEIIGARRASRTDPEVMAEMLRIWESGDKEISFQNFVEDLVSREVPPIVIQYGDEFEGALPAVMAEAQYYGYRAKAIEPDLNRISVFAERSGIKMDWLYGNMENESEIRERIQLLEKILDLYRSENSAVVELAEKFFADWRHARKDALDNMDKYSGGDAETEEHLFEIFGFIGAIDWLRFWSDKGFAVAADY